VALERPHSEAKATKIPTEISEYKKAFVNYLRKGNESQLASLEKKTLSVGSNTDGGYLVTHQMSELMIKAIFETSPMRQLASITSISSDALDAYGIIDSQAISEKDILNGLYDGAEVSIFLIDYLNPGHGKIIIRSGYIGDIQIKGQQFVAQIRGLTQACEKEIGELYSPLCRAKFGDSRCKVCKKSWTYEGVISEVITDVKFSDDSRT
jgi:hypothetical protein